MFRIKPDEHVSIVGKTGSGKSTLARALLHGRTEQSRGWLGGRYPIAILDTKQAGDFDDFPKLGFVRIRHLKDLPDAFRRSRLVIFSPVRAEKTLEHYEGFLSYMLQLGPHMTYIDELYDLIREGVPDSYEEYMKLGRGHGMSLWQGTQNPVFIPHDFFSNSTHMFVFRLKLQTDRDKMARIVGDELLNKRSWPDRYGFWYSADDDDVPFYHPNQKSPFAVETGGLSGHDKRGQAEEGGGKVSGMTRYVVGLLVFALVMALLIPAWHMLFKAGKAKGVPGAGVVSDIMEQ